MISPADFGFLRQLLHSEIGLVLDEGKEYLVESRLTPVAAALGPAGLPGLLRRLREGSDPAVVRAVCEAMITNESFFFRDVAPFFLLRDRVLPELIEARRGARRLRIWCAAAATGQEPYSVAMLLADRAGDLAGWDVEILATDYSRHALERARVGLYNDFEAQRGLPAELLSRFFTRRGADWLVCDRIRSAVTFREGNLLQPFRSMGCFDLILCRNVLIYFGLPLKRDVLERMVGALAPDGYLLLGGTETATGITDRLERVPDSRTSLYRPARSAPPL